MTLAARVEEQAKKLQLARAAQNALTWPFYVLGFVAGAFTRGVRWVCAAVLIGWKDGLNESRPSAG